MTPSPNVRTFLPTVLKSKGSSSLNDDAFETLLCVTESGTALVFCCKKDVDTLACFLNFGKTKLSQVFGPL